MGTLDQATVQGLIQSYINAVTRPTAATYAAELGNGSWLKVFIGVGVVSIVSVLISLLTAGNTAANVDQSLQQLRAQGSSESTIQSIKQFIAFLSSGGGLLAELLLSVLFFFLGALVMYIFARVFGGSGTDFMTHSYLLSLSYTPIRLVVSLLGALIGLGLGLATARYLNAILSAFPGLPMAIDFFLFQPSAAWTALALLVASGIAAGVYPAWRAASLPIAESLRREAIA